MRNVLCVVFAYVFFCLEYFYFTKTTDVLYLIRNSCEAFQRSAENTYRSSL